MTLTLDDLGYPFHCVVDSSQLDDLDTTFSYQVIFSPSKTRAMCNDICCESCAFSCKDAVNRQQVLIDFARREFPEFQL